MVAFLDLVSFPWSSQQYK